MAKSTPTTIEPCPTCRSPFKPFNGGVIEVRMKYRMGVPKHWVQCTKCQRRTTFYRSSDTAIQEWNRGRTVAYAVPKRKKMTAPPPVVENTSGDFVRKSVTVTTKRAVHIDLPRPANFLNFDGVSMDVGHFSEEEALFVGRAIAEQFVQHVRQRRKARLAEQRKGLD